MTSTRIQTNMATVQYIGILNMTDTAGSLNFKIWCTAREVKRLNMAGF
jgi:hypothetical protein